MVQCCLICIKREFYLKTNGTRLAEFRWGRRTILEDVTPLKKKINMLKIIIPILITQVALYLMTFFRYSYDWTIRYIPSAGVTIGSSFWVPVYTGLCWYYYGTYANNCSPYRRRVKRTMFDHLFNKDCTYQLYLQQSYFQL